MKASTDYSPAIVVYHGSVDSGIVTHGHSYFDVISMGWCKKDVTPVWSIWPQNNLS